MTYINIEVKLFLDDAIVIAKNFIDYIKVKKMESEMADLIGILEELIDDFNKLEREENGN